MSALPAAPSERQMRLRGAAFAPMRRWLDPRVEGIENLPPDGGFLLVGNHSLYGVNDMLLPIEIFARRGIVIRGLADRDLFRIPGLRDVLTLTGAVVGSRENCAALMRAGEPVLVFPGGSSEVWKAPGQRYQLLWGDRVGFAAMAIAHGYPIVPFASLGGDEMYDISFDIEHPLAAPLRVAVDQLGLRRNNVPSFGPGWGGTPLPRPVDMYLGFGRPIETASLSGREDERDACEAVRNEVRDAIYAELERLVQLRAARGETSLIGRLARVAGLRG